MNPLEGGVRIPIDSLTRSVELVALYSTFLKDMARVAAEDKKKNPSLSRAEVSPEAEAEIKALAAKFFALASIGIWDKHSGGPMIEIDLLHLSTMLDDIEKVAAPPLDLPEKDNLN